jgi:hypothetical protein
MQETTSCEQIVSRGHLLGETSLPLNGFSACHLAPNTIVERWLEVDSLPSHTPPNDRSQFAILLHSFDHACFFQLSESSAKDSRVQPRV